MDPEGLAGFREIEHVADWELEVWAPDLTALLEQAARGMYTLAGLKLEGEQPIERSFRLEFQDAESLLVTFLNELLYYLEMERLVFERFDLVLEKDSLLARLSGTKIASPGKEIKAATYHNLEIRQSPAGLQAKVVLDV